MKKTIVTLVTVIMLAGCGSTQFDPQVDMADVMKSAQCIEQAVYCADTAQQFMAAKDWDVIGRAYDNFEKCVSQLADMGCRMQAEELYRTFTAAKEANAK